MGHSRPNTPRNMDRPRTPPGQPTPRTCAPAWQHNPILYYTPFTVFNGSCMEQHTRELQPPHTTGKVVGNGFTLASPKASEPKARTHVLFALMHAVLLGPAKSTIHYMAITFVGFWIRDVFFTQHRRCLGAKHISNRDCCRHCETPKLRDSMICDL